MTCLASYSEFTTFAPAWSQRVRRSMSMRATAVSVMRSGAMLLALSSLTVPDAVLHAKWFKFGLILDSAHRHYATQS